MSCRAPLHAFPPHSFRRRHEMQAVSRSAHIVRAANRPTDSLVAQQKCRSADTDSQTDTRIQCCIYTSAQTQTEHFELRSRLRKARLSPRQRVVGILMLLPPFRTPSPCLACCVLRLCNNHRSRIANSDASPAWEILEQTSFNHGVPYLTSIAAFRSVAWTRCLNLNSRITAICAYARNALAVPGPNNDVFSQVASTSFNIQSIIVI